jgi:hypothetical protein
MIGAQLASRVLYACLGPRRHIVLGLAGAADSMAQVFVPNQAAAFATISPEATGKASTMFNAMRQVGGAIGVALLTTAIVLIGPTHLVGGHEVANLTAYRITFLVAAAFRA